MTSQPDNIKLIASKAAAIRRHIVRSTHLAGSGHPGGSLSAADILASLYFGGVFQHNPQQPNDPTRDRFILSKGHAAPALYATLAEAGYFAVAELDSLRQLGSHLQGHPDWLKTAGVEVSTGSLGQGLSIATGLALALELQNQLATPSSLSSPPRIGVRGRLRREAARPPQVVTLLGDGELQEGQVWEALMYAAAQHCGNLIAIIDNNNLQIDGALDEVVSLGNIAAKLRSFGWQTIEVDGHDVPALLEALAQAFDYTAGPFAMVAHTIKGKGVSFMEHQTGWHGKACDAAQAQQALADLA